MYIYVITYDHQYMILIFWVNSKKAAYPKRIQYCHAAKENDDSWLESGVADFKTQSLKSLVKP